MKDNNQTIDTLHNLLDFNAGKFTSAEIQLRKSIPGWINKADSLQLKTVLQNYLDFVKQHVRKMESFFVDENFRSLSLINRVMQSFIEETNEKLFICADAVVTDACLLACIQDINHFKISTYGSAASFAHALGLEKAAALFHELGTNEKNINDRLSQLAEYDINIQAKALILLQ